MKLTRLLHLDSEADFAAALRTELAEQAQELPLQQGASEGGYCDATELQVTLLHNEQDEHYLYTRIGVFFTEIVANCSCGDEPMHKPAYCEMLLHIDRTTGETTARVMAD